MLKALMLRKKINDAKKELDALRAKSSDFETRAADIEKRSDETAQAIEEASTEEEKAAVEEAITAIEADQAALDSEKTENAQKIADLEKEVSEMETELEQVEEQQRAKAPAAEPEKIIPETPTKIERNTNKMFKTRSLNRMSVAERAELVAREDVQKTLAEVRTFIKEKRSVTGANLTIGETILGLVRENIIDYSKLLARVNTATTNKDGRVIVQGIVSEAVWTECCAALNELNLEFGQVELDCYKVAGYLVLCNAAIEDSDIDLVDAVVIGLAQSIGKALDKAIVYGTGVKMPTGAVTAIASTASQLVTISSSDHDKKFFQDIIKAAAKADSKYSRGEKLWIMNDQTYATVMSEAVAVDGSGAYVSMVNGRMPAVGGEIIALNDVPDNNIVMGYFDLYALLEKKGITIDTSEHVKFLDDQTVVRGRGRYDGKPVIAKAFVAIGIGSAPTTEVSFPGQDDPES